MASGQFHSVNSDPLYQSRRPCEKCGQPADWYCRRCESYICGSHVRDRSCQDQELANYTGFVKLGDILHSMYPFARDPTSKWTGEFYTDEEAACDDLPRE